MSVETKLSEVLVSCFDSGGGEDISSLEFSQMFRQCCADINLVDTSSTDSSAFFAEIENVISEDLPDDFSGFATIALCSVYQASVVLEGLRSKFLMPGAEELENSGKYSRQSSQFEYVRVFALFEAVMATVLGSIRGGVKSGRSELERHKEISSGFSYLLADLHHLMVRLASLEPVVDCSSVQDTMGSLMKLQSRLSLWKPNK